MSIGRLFLVKEAIHSVAMEHAGDCDCTICRAASGDEDAFGEVLRSVDADTEQVNDP